MIPWNRAVAEDHARSEEDRGGSEERSNPVDEFEIRYLDGGDPWGFATSSYEQRKYGITAASLPRDRYRRCFEPGCSIGALTERLARVCGEVVAWDGSPSAIDTARRRFDSIGSDVGRIAFETARIPESLPDGIFDLVVFSEIGYYWDIAGLAHVVESLVDRCEVGADFVAVHWLGHSGDHRLHGAVVHEVIAMSLAERQSFRLVSHVEPEFVLDIWRLA